MLNTQAAIQDLQFIKFVLKNVSNKVLIIDGKFVYVHNAIEKINDLLIIIKQQS